MHSLNPLVCFNAGEWSPSMDARLDLPNYRKACRIVRNVIPSKQGGVTRRPGTQFIGSGKPPKGGSPTTSRLEKFQYAPGTTFILEFCDLGVRFYSNGVPVQAPSPPGWVSGTNYPNGAFVTDGGITYYLYNGPLIPSTNAPGSDGAHWITQTTYEVPLPYSGTNFTAPNYWDADVFVLQVKQINDVVYIVHPNFPVYKITRYADDNWVSEQVAFLTPPMLDQNPTDIYMVPSATTGNGIVLDVNAAGWTTATYYLPGNSVNAMSALYTCVKAHVSGVFATDLANGYWKHVTMFQAGHVGSYWQIVHNRPSSYIEFPLTGNGISAVLSLIGTWEVATYGTWIADITVEASYDNGVTWQVVTTLTSRADANFNISGQDIGGGQYRMVITNWSSVASTTPPRVVLTADNQFVYGLVQIASIVNLYRATANVVVPLFSTLQTIFWSEGAWSGLRGYPQAITIFQERVWYGASTFQPQRVWGTQTDDLENFAKVDSSQDSYGLAFDLNAPGRGPINWLNAQTDLFAGLAGAEWIISSGQPNVGITPTKVQAVEHSVNGSAPALPGVIIGNACFYAQRKGTSFQQMLFSVFTNKYMSSDMQVLSQHLTNAGIKQFDYQQQFQNQSLLWAVIGDGSLVSLTYSMDQEVFGWAKHTTGDQVAGNTPIAVITGQTYTILTVGTTDWTLYGAPRNTVGTIFVADMTVNPFAGTGTASTKTDFGFLSVQVIYGADGQDDEVWVTVQRKGLNYATVERLWPIDWQTSALGLPDLTKSVYADCASVRTSPVSNVITGLPAELDNRSGICVCIIPASGIGAWAVNGLNQGPASGTVTIPNYAPAVGDTVVIGLAINWALQPMRLDIDLRAGPVAAVRKAISKLYLRVLNSMGGNWATVQGNIIPIQWIPINQNPNNPPPFTPTTPLELEIDVGALMQYENDPVFVILGNDPLPFSLLGVIVVYDLEGKT